jgi:Tfp pilus assembly protein PilP
MGRSFGRITQISRDSVTVLETVKDANGAWVAQEKVLMVPNEGGRK